MNEFWLFKNGVGCANPDYQATRPDKSIEDEFIHVITMQEHQRIVDELKWEIEDLKAQLRFS